MTLRPLVLMAWLVVLAFALGCESRQAPPTQATRGMVRYRIEAGSTAEPFAFLLELPASGLGTARIHSGRHEFEARVVENGPTIRVVMPVYNSEIRLRSVSSGLTGELILSTAFGGKGTFALRGTATTIHGLGGLITVPPKAPLDLGELSHWRVSFKEGAGRGKLTLQRVATGVYSAVLFLDNGDMSYMAGVGDADRLTVAGFDGTSVFRIAMHFDPQRTHGSGEWLAGHAEDWRDTVTLERSDDFTITHNLRPERPDVVVRLPALTPYIGRPVLLELGASWCSTCRSITPVLHTLYDAFHPRGLEMVTLLFEFSEDPAYNAEQVQKFVEEYKVPWQVIAVPGDVSDLATQLPSGLAGASTAAFPHVLFLTRDHVVHAAHAGFPMDPTEPAALVVIGQFHRWAQEIVQ